MTEETCFCPNCGSSRVDVSALIGGSCSCRACDWSGRSEDLHKYRYKTDLLVGSDAITKFSIELRNLVATKMSMDIGRFLVSWGFLPSTAIDSMVWGRYMNAIARAAAVAIVQTRDEIESELKDERVCGT